MERSGIRDRPLKKLEMDHLDIVFAPQNSEHMKRQIEFYSNLYQLLERLD